MKILRKINSRRLRSRRWLGRFLPGDEESWPVLESISIKNFKAFDDWVEIPIKPITLVFGKNSAGKSSIFHALLWIRELNVNGNLNQRRTSRSGDFLDLGGLHQYLHSKESEKSKDIGYKIKLKDEKKILKSEYVSFLRNFYESLKRDLHYLSKLEQDNIRKKIEELKSDSDHRTPFFLNNNEPDIIEIELTFDVAKVGVHQVFGKIYVQPKIEVKINGLVFFTAIPNSNVSNKRRLRIQDEDRAIYKGEFSGEAMERFYDVYKEVLTYIWKDNPKNEHGLELDHVLETKRDTDLHCHQWDFKKFDQNSHWLDWNGMAGGLRSFFSYRGRGFIRSREDRKMNAFMRLRTADSKSEQEDIIKKTPLVIMEGIIEDIFYRSLETIFSINRFSLRKLLGGLNYLPAVRKYPERVLSESNLYSSIDEEIYGNKSYKAIFESKKTLRKLRTVCNDLGATFDLKVSGRFRSVYGRALILFYPKKKKEISFRDIGFGWSQVFPVLVEILSDESPLLMIEQPELHLHPSAQSQLMAIVMEQVFFEREENNKRRTQQGLNRWHPIMLEAHSEQMAIKMLHAIQNFKRDTNRGQLSIDSDQCCLLYVLNNGKKSEVKRIHIDKQGNIGNQWPPGGGGFFESAMQDLVGGKESCFPFPTEAN